MSFVFDVEKLKGSDSKLIDYFTESEHAVRGLKIRPTYITFQDLPQKNNYAKFTIDPVDGAVSSELRHLSFEEENENANNEVWHNINVGEWIDEFDIIAILEHYVIWAEKNTNKNNNTNKNKNTNKKTRKNKAKRK